MPSGAWLFAYRRTLNRSHSTISINSDMRLHLALSGNTVPVPFTYAAQLAGRFHAWLGDNDVHDGLSLYTISSLSGGKVRSGTLHFPSGAMWRLSFADTALAERVKNGIMANQDVAFGMRVYDVTVQLPPRFSTPYRFEVDAPVLVRRNRDDGGRDHLSWDDPAADEALTRTFRRKLAAAGLEADMASMAFDRTYSRAKTKVVTPKPGLRFKANVCPVLVAGTPEAVQFAWLVGAGEQTGMGFGALRGPVPPNVARPMPVASRADS